MVRGVVIGPAEFAAEARLAIPDFRAYKTRQLREVPRGAWGVDTPA